MYLYALYEQAAGGTRGQVALRLATDRLASVHLLLPLGNSTSIFRAFNARQMANTLYAWASYLASHGSFDCLFRS
jgi:hypothetical protein